MTTKLKIAEKDIQRTIKDYLQVMENQGKLMFIRSNSLAVQTKDGHYVQTGKKGSPDILVWARGKLIVLTDKDFIRCIALEVKSSIGKQSPAQKEWQNKFEKFGGEYYIVRSVEEVMNIIKRR